MEFYCYDVETKRYIGRCTLQDGCYDPVGTEHLFNDKAYKLVKTEIGQLGGIMSFERILTTDQKRQKLINQINTVSFNQMTDEQIQKIHEVLERQIQGERIEE